jgi:Ca2+-transporting ATPase
VWLETMIHPTAMLAFQQMPSGGRLRRMDGRRPARFFTRGEWALILASGLLLTATVAFGYARSLGGGGVEHARAMALAVLTLASAALAATLSRLRTGAARVISGATVAVSAVVIQTPPLAALVHVSPLHMDDWAIAIAGRGGGGLASDGGWRGATSASRPSGRARFPARDSRPGSVRRRTPCP